MIENEGEGGEEEEEEKNKKDRDQENIYGSGKQLLPVNKASGDRFQAHTAN